MNRIIHTLSTSRTAVILLLATLLTATAAQTARAQILIINTADDWNTFASNVNGGRTYSGLTVTPRILCFFAQRNASFFRDFLYLCNIKLI